MMSNSKGNATATLTRDRLRSDQHMEVPRRARQEAHGPVDLPLGYHDNAQENILELFEQLLRGRVQPHAIEPIVVTFPNGVDDGLGVRSRNNRRLLGVDSPPPTPLLLSSSLSSL